MTEKNQFFIYLYYKKIEKNKLFIMVNNINSLHQFVKVDNYELYL